MFRWYVVNTYSGHENKVKQNLEHRVISLNQKRNVRQVVVHDFAEVECAHRDRGLLHGVCCKNGRFHWTESPADLIGAALAAASPATSLPSDLPATRASASSSANRS